MIIRSIFKKKEENVNSNRRKLVRFYDRIGCINAKSLKLKIFALVSFILVFISCFLSFNNKKVYAEDYTSYYVTNLDVEARLDSNNVYHVEEIYQVNLNQQSETFNVPILKKMGKGSVKSKQIIKIKNVYVDGYDFNVKNYNDRKVVEVKIDNSIKLNKDKVFQEEIKVSYDYDFGEDYIDETDRIYLALSNRYNTSRIATINFMISLPKNINGRVISTTLVNENNEEIDVKESNINVKVINKGKTIKGEYKTAIKAYNGLMLQCDVQEGYFEEERNTKNNELMLIGLYLICLGVCLVHFFLCGRDSTIIYSKTNKYPDDMSPLVVNAFNTLDDNAHLNKVFSMNVISAMIVKWANLGYITIEEIKGDNGKNDYRLRRLKESTISQMPYFEKIIYDSLFVLGVNDTVDTALVKSNMMPFKECIEYFKSQIESSKENVCDYYYQVKACAFDKAAYITKNNLKILSLLSFIIAVFYKQFLYFTSTSGLILPALFIIILAIIYFKVLKDNFRINAIVLALTLVLGLFMTKIEIISYILLSITSYLIILVRRFSFEYEVAVEKIKGFKKFILDKKDRAGIVNTLAENPKYFYEALPYVIALGVTDEFVLRLKEFSIAMPGWLYEMHPKDFSLDTILHLVYDFEESLVEIKEGIINIDLKNNNEY